MGWPKSKLELSFVLVLIMVIVMMTVGKIRQVVSGSEESR